MEKKIDNKASYYFGDKPVVYKEADEDEFEGSVLEQANVIAPEEMTEQLLTLNLADFWNQIWIELVTLKCTVEISEDYSNVLLKEVSAVAREKYAAESPYQMWNENASGANKKGWNWAENTKISIKNFFNLDSLAAAVLSYMIRRESGFSLNRKAMQVAPNEESTYKTWIDFLNDAFNFCEHNVTGFKGKPRRDVVLLNDGKTKVTIAQADETTFVVVEYSGL
jgi:hypothetical protein